MANNIQIYQLPAKSSAALTDVYAVDDNPDHISWKVTGQQLVNLIAANIAIAPYAVGDILYANTTTTLAKLADVAVNNVLLSGGVGAAPSYGKVTYSHLQNEAANTLLGNPTGSPAIPSEITLGAGLAFSGTSLIATGDASVTLQDAYNNGDGTITLVADKPLKLQSTVAGFEMPAMSDAQYSAISNLENGEMAWSTDQDRISVNTGDVLSPAIEQVAYLSDIAALSDDAIVGEMYFQGNETPTTISVAGTPVKVNATYSSGTLLGFSFAGGTLTYENPEVRAVNVTVVDATTYDGSINNTSIYIARNGEVIAKSKQTAFLGGITPAPQSVPVQCSIEDLTQDDEIEVWIANEDTTDDPIVKDLNIIVSSVGGLSYGGVTVVGEDYLTIAGQEITAHPVNLSNTNAIGILAAGRFPALDGDITTVAGDLTTTLATVNSNVGSFGDATHVGAFTVNGKGLVTAASSVAITGTTPGGSAGGDLTGNYPNPTIANAAVTYAKIQNISAPNILLGRYTGGAGSTQEIKLGTNLSLTGDTLNAGGGSTSSLQDAYDNGNIIDLAINTPFQLQISVQDPIIETVFYNNLSPTVPALINIKKYQAFDASNLGFDAVTERVAYWDSTGSASKYSKIWAMYEGGSSNVTKDYFSISSKYRQNEFYRTVTIDPVGTAAISTQADLSACFQVISTTVGTIPAPRMTESQRNSIISPADALLVYNTDINRYNFYDANEAAWKTLLAETGEGSIVEVLATCTSPTTSYAGTIGSFTSVAQTLNGSKTIAANSFKPGETIELSITGHTSAVTTGGSGKIRCKFGPITFDSQTVTSSLGGSGTVRAWQLNFKVTAVSSTQITIFATSWFEDDSHNMKALQLYHSPVVNTFDLTVDNDIDVLYNMTVGHDAYNFVADNLNIVKYAA